MLRRATALKRICDRQRVQNAASPVSSDIQVPRHDGKKHQDLPH